MLLFGSTKKEQGWGVLRLGDDTFHEPSINLESCCFSPKLHARVLGPGVEDFGWVTTDSTGLTTKWGLLVASTNTLVSLTWQMSRGRRPLAGGLISERHLVLRSPFVSMRRDLGAFLFWLRANRTVNRVDVPCLAAGYAGSFVAVLTCF